MRRLMVVGSLTAVIAACGSNPPSSGMTTAAASSRTTAAATTAPTVASTAPSASTAQVPPTPAAAPSAHSIALPGGPAPVWMDYLAFDAATMKLWVPAGNTGNVDVIDDASETVTPVAGFATREFDRQGHKRTVGPSSVAVGDGVVYVGNRADSKICAVDAKSLKIGNCLALSSSPDGIAYVKSAKELWVTTPRDQSLVVLDASTPGTLKPKASIKLAGGPEGYAVDDAHGVFYTNLEDTNATLAIDIASRKVTSTWKTDCNADGPRGLAIDPAKRFLFVACTDHTVTVDAGHHGEVLGSVQTGAGVDNIDYAAALHLVYVASGKTATLTVAKVDDKGALTVAGTVPTGDGARVVVVDPSGKAFIADSAQGRIDVAMPPPK